MDPIYFFTLQKHYYNFIVYNNFEMSYTNCWHFYLNLEELSTNPPTKFPQQRAGRHLVNVRSACQCHTCTWLATCSLVSFSAFISSRILLVQLLQQQQNKGQNKNELLQYIKSKSEGWQFLLSIPRWLKATINFWCSSTDQITLGFLADEGSSPS